MKETLTLGAKQLDGLPEETLLSLLDLRDIARRADYDAEYTARYRNDEGETWDFPCYLVVVGSRAVLWSRTDEAGVSDETLVEEPGDDLSGEVREFADDLASQLGTLVGDGKTCPGCKQEIEWSGIQTQQYQANWMTGSCGCRGRTWHNEERGAWRYSYTDEAEE